MEERIATRLDELRAELSEGRRMDADLEARRADLVATMLRIEGAIAALEELAEEQAEAPPAVAAGGRPGELGTSWPPC